MQIDTSITKKEFQQVDAIFALEGFTPNADRRVIDEAILAGKITPSKVVEEIVEYVQIHKSMEGFIDSRSW